MNNVLRWLKERVAAPPDTVIDQYKYWLLGKHWAVNPCELEPLKRRIGKACAKFGDELRDACKSEGLETLLDVVNEDLYVRRYTKK